jgi:hypothetical protein
MIFWKQYRMEGSGHVLFQGSVPAFTWREWGKPVKFWSWYRVTWQRFKPGTSQINLPSQIAWWHRHVILANTTELHDDPQASWNMVKLLCAKFKKECVCIYLWFRVKSICDGASDGATGTGVNTAVTYRLVWHSLLSLFTWMQTNSFNVYLHADPTV